VTTTLQYFARACACRARGSLNRGVTIDLLAPIYRNILTRPKFRSSRRMSFSAEPSKSSQTMSMTRNPSRAESSPIIQFEESIRKRNSMADLNEEPPPPVNFKIATGYRLDDRGVEIRVPVGSRIFISPCRSDRLVKLTTHIQLVPRSRKCGSIHPLPHTPSWHNVFFGWDLHPHYVPSSGPLGSGSLGLFVQVP
jgi:hypothetical protein